tara:strand:+ start:171 stop:824 length:654 start_codon:yes stop_codon:yes gene_type:complete
MIKASSEDIQNLKKIIPKNHLIIASSNYTGFRNFLGFVAQFIVNPIQRLTGAFYDNKKNYIAHIFTVFWLDDELWVGEMDKKETWKENPIEKSNTFIKLKKGQIDFFDLGKIEDQKFKDFLEYAKFQKYSILEAISSLKLFRFLNLFISYKERFQSNKAHCGSVFLKYKPFHKVFKITGKEFFRKYKTHHPEAIDHYLIRNFDQKIVKVKRKKIQWS